MDMFGRIRQATDRNDDGYGLREDWAASASHATRVMKEQAPIHGLAGISEGATVGSVLFVRRAPDGESFHVLISICALTSPGHARIYEDGIVSPVASLHLVGGGDTSDVRHMVGRTAALFGLGSGVACFTGGHKLPPLNGILRCQFERLLSSMRLRDARDSSVCAHASI